MRITTLVGNPKPASRTLAVAEAAAASLFDLAKFEHRVIDLAEHVAEVFSWPSASMDEMTAAVATSDVVFVASPTLQGDVHGLAEGVSRPVPHQRARRSRRYTGHDGRR